MSEQINATHYGLMYGLVPVRIDMTDPDVPAIEVRHWSLEPVLDVCEAIYGVLLFLRSTVDPDYEPTFPIKITRELKQ